VDKRETNEPHIMRANVNGDSAYETRVVISTFARFSDRSDIGLWWSETIILFPRRVLLACIENAVV